MKIRHTMMFTSQLLAFIQSRSFGIARTARRWKSRKPSSGSAAISAVSRMNGSAAVKRVVVLLEVGRHRQHHDEVRGHEEDHEQAGPERLLGSVCLELAEPLRAARPSRVARSS